MIKDCILMTNQPAFFRDVMDGDVKVATIKAKTRNDEIELENRAIERKFVGGKLESKSNMGLYTLIRIRQALTGNDKCGWELADEAGKLLEITEEILDVIPSKYYQILATAVLNHDMTWENEENKEAISKN